MVGLNEDWLDEEAFDGQAAVAEGVARQTSLGMATRRYAVQCSAVHQDQPSASSIIVLQYEYESGLICPCWTSVAPDEASGRWKLQVITTSNQPVAVLVLDGLPMVWMNSAWDSLKHSVFSLTSPAYMRELVGPVTVYPYE